MPWYDAVGYIGVVSYQAAYFLLQSRRLSIDSYFYGILNVIGALCLLVSLSFNINMPSIIAQIIWLIISIIGFYKTRKHKKDSSL